MFVDLLRNDDEFLDWDHFQHTIYNLTKIDSLSQKYPSIRQDFTKYFKSMKPRICIDNYVNLKLFIKEIKTWMEFSIQSQEEIKQ